MKAKQEVEWARMRKESLLLQNKWVKKGSECVPGPHAYGGTLTQNHQLCITIGERLAAKAIQASVCDCISSLTVSAQWLSLFLPHVSLICLLEYVLVLGCECSCDERSPSLSVEDEVSQDAICTCTCHLRIAHIT